MDVTSAVTMFSTLCVVMYSGGTDCSYVWTQVPDDTLLLESYYAAGGQKPYTKQLVAFTDMDNKQVWFGWGTSSHAVVHEIKHVICHLEYERHGMHHPDCKGHYRF